MQYEDVLIMLENYEDFRQWYRDFDNENGRGDMSYTREWFNQVQKAHEKLREFLNDNIEVTWPVTIKEKAASLIKSTEAKKILQKIQELSKYERNLFGVTTKDIVGPTIQLGSHKGVKTNKFLMKCFDDYNCPDDYRYKEKLAELNKCLSQLAALWNKEKTSSATYEVTLDTSAEAFVNLGYYGPDEDSCFRQGRCGEKSKYILARSKNTYVLTISKKDKCLVRAWGFSNDKFDTWNICNIYQKGVNEGNILAAIQQYFATLLGLEQEDIKVHEDRRVDQVMDEDPEDIEGKIEIPEGIYHNTYGSFTFSTKERITQQKLHCLS